MLHVFSMNYTVHTYIMASTEPNIILAADNKSHHLLPQKNMTRYMMFITYTNVFIYLKAVVNLIKGHTNYHK